jgi:hypothetical protein
MHKPIHHAQTTRVMAGAGVPSEPRKVLTAEDAIEIYSVKIRKTPRDSWRLAAAYGITSRTVRNIWNHCTWAHSTMHLWSPKERQEFLQARLCDTCKGTGAASLDHVCAGCVRILAQDRHRIACKDAAAKTPVTVQPLAPPAHDDIFSAILADQERKQHAKLDEFVCDLIASLLMKGKTTMYPTAVASMPETPTVEDLAATADYFVFDNAHQTCADPFAGDFLCALDGGPVCDGLDKVPGDIGDHTAPTSLAIDREHFDNDGWLVDPGMIRFLSANYASKQESRETFLATLVHGRP